MKIYIITCSYAYNYGAVLQAYGLSEYLKQYQHDVQVINYIPDYARSIKGKNIISKLIRPIVRKIDYIKGNEVFNKFLGKYINLTPRVYKNITELKTYLPEADVYIAGSDQIWNCDLPNGYDDSFFLSFTPKDKKKISYAASIAMDSLNEEQKNRFYNMLKDFYKISVREKTAVKILSELNLAKEVTRVVDPVFLLSREQWQKLSQKEDREKEKYILVYGFNGQKDLFQYAKKLAKEKGYKLYSINTYIEDYFKGTDKYFWNVTPEKFLNLIENAEMIITNSFHGLSFSIIFNKKVRLFFKKGKANSRMMDIIEDLSLGDIISDKFENINYVGVEKKLKALKNKSYDFLSDINNM